jgi:HSP20 family protein
MLATMKWDPLHELMSLHDRAARRSSPPDGAWSPNVDLLETREAFLLRVELPGLAPDEFSITTTGDGILLTGHRRVISPPPVRYLRMERGHGRFSRAFSFGTPVDTSKVQASYAAGLLTVTVPKLHQSGEHRIVIG